MTFSAELSSSTVAVVDGTGGKNLLTFQVRQMTVI